MLSIVAGRDVDGRKWWWRPTVSFDIGAWWYHTAQQAFRVLLQHIKELTAGHVNPHGIVECCWRRLSRLTDSR